MLVLYPRWRRPSNRRQGDRRGRTRSSIGFGEPLDRQPRLRPRAWRDHLVAGVVRPLEHDAVQRRPGRSGLVMLPVLHRRRPLPAPPTPTNATPTTGAAAGCSPIDNEGGCYEPGEIAGTTTTASLVGPVTATSSPASTGTAGTGSRERPVAGTGDRRRRGTGTRPGRGGSQNSGVGALPATFHSGRRRRCIMSGGTIPIRRTPPRTRRA